MSEEKLTVSKKEREDMPFKILPGVVGIKIVDVDKVVEMIRAERRKSNQSMIIQLNPLKEDKFKDPYWSKTFDKDPKTGIYYGIVSKIYPDGNPKWFKINIHEFLTLNLDNDADAKIWAILRMHSSVKGTPLQVEFNADPEISVLDLEVEAGKEINNAMDIAKAVTRAKNLTGEKMLYIARALGISVNQNSSPKMIKGAIMTRAVKSPVSFNAHYDDENRNVIENFATAETLQIIKMIPQKGYFFSDIPLGINKPSAIAAIKADGQLMMNIANEILRLDTVGKKIMAEDAVAKKDEEVD